MIKTKKYIEEILTSGTIDQKDKLKCLISKIVEDSEDRRKIFTALYTIINGYHFDECMLEKALNMIGGEILTREDIKNKISLYGIKLPECVTICDMSYAIHMFYSDFDSLDLPEKKVFEWAYLYCTDEDYPIKNGKCFAEWSYKMSLID